jgi:alkylhydroperoxidase/carboxymuconolactone decarboxylase family protein YurZ
MTPTRVHLAALIVRDARLFLVREGARWSLPGGELPPGQDDIPREMGYILERHGISAPSIEEDFLETHYFRDEAGPVVLNLYAPTGWEGDLDAPSGLEGAWFAVEELPTLQMDGPVRSAVLQAFGVEAGPDPAEESLRDFEQPLAGGKPNAPEDAPPPADALDVLRTLSGRTTEDAVESLRKRYGEFAGDVLGAIDLAWTGPAIDRKTRSLMVLSAVAAQGGRGRALRAHAEGALNHGATRDELVEMMRVIAVYAGFPAAIEAWPVVEEALTRRGMGRPE